MKILFHKNIVKQAEKLDDKIKKQLAVKLKLFSLDPYNPALRNHPLTGDFKGYRSINITGDYRAIYEQEENDLNQFYEIGTHSELYG